MQKGKNYKIGYTTGVFDMFHIGHLNILRRAKEQCEYLIVGVSTDELVKEYKHCIPIIPFNDRIEIVKSIRYVDQVVEQISMDKLLAYEKYQFNVIFHGDDWKNNSYYINMEKELEKRNVDLVYFPYTPNISSTILRKYLSSGVSKSL